MKPEDIEKTPVPEVPDMPFIIVDKPKCLDPPFLPDQQLGGTLYRFELQAKVIALKASIPSSVHLYLRYALLMAVDGASETHARYLVASAE